jgi:hypothetical protein
MADVKNTNVAQGQTSKPKKAKKPPSAKRLAAVAAVDMAVKKLEAAKSPQEKQVAESAVTAARNELKLLKFVEIGQPRIRRAIDVLRQLENVANRNAYKWTDEQALKASKALTDALRKVTDKLAGNKDAKAEDKFTF